MTTTNPATDVTVNRSTAVLYEDKTFAAAGFICSGVANKSLEHTTK